MNAAPSDVVRLLRAFALRAWTLALLVGIAGDALLTIVFALAGVGLLLAPAETVAGCRPGPLDEVLPPSRSPTP